MDDVHCLDNSQSPIQDESINISDVIEVIETDPDFKPQQLPRQPKMFGQNAAPVDPVQVRRQAQVRIVEQPASKALRFRYECEGRSAGSIPGASSTAENKTFPSIQITGYKGKAVVVVSCVTKDPPYRPHPHNLVGREGCRKGVCTLEISPESMAITFSNLGIQCVKKKDIEAHLKFREEIRVDPFKTGFDHRNQPTSIDLNAVRLCFQVFVEGDKPGKFTLPLAPVVSDPIYDKKAMSDLVIVKLSDCVSTVDGGRKDIILLCEKVAKEDIQVRFYEEKDGMIVWEGFGDFQPSQVHKQTAIWFKTPRYKTLDITEPVKVNIQLRRPSDGATSEPLPFELLPLDSGRPSFWSIRRNFAKKGNYSLFNSLLSNENHNLTKQLTASIEKMDAEEVNDLPAYGEIKKVQKPIENNENNENNENFINVVAELDEIYADNQKRIEESNQIELDCTNNNNNSINNNNNTIINQESFDDSKTYSSLQMAFKNPLQIVDININDKYEDVIVNPECPVIDVGTKRENETEKLPPLPPKRAKKVIETDICDVDPRVSTQTLNKLNENSSINLSSHDVTTLSSSAPIITRSQSYNTLKGAPSKKLPPTPSSTLPNPKKRGFLSKLFGRKDKSNQNSRSSSIDPIKRNSLSSAQSLQVNPTLNRSPSNVSNKSAVSIRIPLKGSLSDLNNDQLNIQLNDQLSGQLNDLSSDQINQLNDLSKVNNNNFDICESELMENDDFNMNLDLTEAEHYALYTAMAPHATQSEFDEMSAYYAPVEGGKLLTEADMLLKMSQNNKT